MNFYKIYFSRTSVFSGLFNQALLILTLGLISNTVVASNYQDTTVGIEVSGQGSIDVLPDDFVLSLVISERGHVVNSLRGLVDKKSNMVIDIARSLNVSKDSISSARVNLSIVEDKKSIQVQGVEVGKGFRNSVYVDGQQINQQSGKTKAIFELSRSITINFDSLAQYDQLLSQIMAVQVSKISPLAMSVKDQEAYYQEALLLAIDNAKQKATQMAKQSGKSIGELIYIKETSSNHFRPVFAQSMMEMSNNNSHQSLVTKKSINARVIVRFALK